MPALLCSLPPPRSPASSLLLIDAVARPPASPGPSPAARRRPRTAMSFDACSLPASRLLASASSAVARPSRRADDGAPKGGAARRPRTSARRAGAAPRGSGGTTRAGGDAGAALAAMLPEGAEQVLRGATVVGIAPAAGGCGTGWRLSLRAGDGRVSSRSFGSVLLCLPAAAAAALAATAGRAAAARARWTRWSAARGGCHLGSSGLKVVLHASSPLTAPSIAALLASLVCPGPFSLLSSAAYPQYPASPPPPHLPLRPLREHGCVPLCEAPALVAAGDWAKGRGAVQAAVDSGERAVGMLRMLRGGEEVKYAVDE
ncbi:hypothetical protein TeGR_g8481 [Tetraparma gracilis]|uniref:Amine oxidase domain-containing protein n=1 Tax=Tetraparma gracilis TaxID=2962635 RepID=A0ABQ6MW93_9STRA|nr:hypothetical protein TeGR_g8481 [Tetraparma gracilis]